MEPIKPKTHELEASIQLKIIKMLEDKDWYVFVTHGNNFQSGFPDLYAIHERYGTRWIEVKQPVGYVFTRAQKKNFHKFSEKGVGIWVLTAATEDEYQRLFDAPNWYVFLMSSTARPTETRNRHSLESEWKHPVKREFDPQQE